MNGLGKTAGFVAAVGAGALAHQGMAGSWAARLLRPEVERDIWALETHGLLEQRANPFPAEDPLASHPGLGGIGWLWFKGLFIGGLIAWLLAVVGCLLFFEGQPPLARLIAGMVWIGPMLWFAGAFVGFCLSGFVLIPMKQQKALREIEWLPLLHRYWNAREIARGHVEQGEAHPHSVASHLRSDWLV